MDEEWIICCFICKSPEIILIFNDDSKLVDNQKSGGPSGAFFIVCENCQEQRMVRVAFSS